MTRAINPGFLRVSVAIIALTALSGCLGSGGGGGGGGGAPSPADYDATLTNVRGKIPTSDMPRSGTASYTGATRLEGVGGNNTGEVIGKIELDVDFGAEASKAISGTASEFSGTIDGKAVNIAGELKTGPDFPAVLAINETVVDVPVVGPKTLVTGAVSIGMYGTLNDGTDESTILLSLGGNFVGPQGEAISGPALIQEITNTSVGEQVGAGEWWALKN